MKFRVRIDVVFDARAIFEASKLLKARAKAIPTEAAFITLEQCGHDETPPQPCIPLESVSLTP